MSRVTYESLQALPHITGIVDRRTFLVDQARGRRVVHLGCVDERLTEARLDAGVLLHAALGAVASELLGVDISQPGLDILRERLPGDYVLGDVEHLAAITLPDSFDVVIASELIEHLPNPGLFLSGLRDLLMDRAAEGIITTPNSFGWVTFMRMAVLRREPTHPDHLLVYSPYTFSAALRMAGLDIQELFVHDWVRGSGWRNRVRSFAASLVLRWNPYLGVGLMARVRAAPDTSYGDR